MQHSIGIMQGRLTPPRGRGIQFFPFDNWRKEFEDAAELGLNEIEFIFDYENCRENPLYFPEGNREIEQSCNKTGVTVHSICFDYFMRRPFYKYRGAEREKIRLENISMVKRMMDAMENIGIGLLEIPLVDDSSIKTDEEKLLFMEFLSAVLESAPQNIKIGLETDMPPLQFCSFLKTAGDSRVFANYDSGNSSGLGYNPYEEITVLKDYICNVHIKDRVYRGKTVDLGTGSADFDSLFKALREIKYTGSFILQAARGAEGYEKNQIKKQIEFLRSYLEQ